MVLVLVASVACRSTEHRSARSVSDLLDIAVTSSTQDQQQQAFDEILKMGCSAVPELAKHLDDSRSLPIRYLRIQNGPNHFEAFAQYGPEIVTDAVATLLSVATCKDFGFIANGGTADARKSVTAGWKNYLRSTSREHVCTCG